MARVSYAASSPIFQPPGDEQTFHGKVDLVDTIGKTMTVDGRLIKVTDLTQITKLGKTIKLSEVMAGEEVHGTGRQAADGRTEALNIKVGPKEKDSFLTARETND